MLDRAPELDAIAAGLAAWQDFRKADELQLSRVMTIGQALLEGRRVVLEKLPEGSNLQSWAYRQGFSAWLEEAGFAEMPRQFWKAALWCAEHEEEVRAAYAAAAACRTRGAPSCHPTALMGSTLRGRKAGPTKRLTPFDRPSYIVTRLRGVLDELEGEERLAFVAEVSGILEEALTAEDDLDDDVSVIDEADAA